MTKLVKDLLINKFNKFLFGGFLNFLLKTVVTFILTEVANIWYFTSYIISLSLVITFSFFYNAYITFRVKNNKKKNFVKYCIVLAVISIVDAASVRLLTDVLNIHYMVSIVLITGILFVVKYLSYDRIVFTENIRVKNIPGNFFDKHSSKNFLVRWLMRKYYRMLISIVSETHPRNILDVGCGEGYIAAKIKDKFSVDIEASDVERDLIKTAKKRFKDIKFSVESAYDLKRKKDGFDLVMLLELLEHLEKPDKAIKESKRVSNRFCLFSVPYEPFWRVANIMRLTYLSDLGNTPGHIQHWTRKGFESMLKKHFRSVKIKRCGLWNFALCEK